MNILDFFLFFLFFFLFKMGNYIYIVGLHGRGYGLTVTAVCWGPSLCVVHFFPWLTVQSSVGSVWLETLDKLAFRPQFSLVRIPHLQQRIHRYCTHNLLFTINLNHRHIDKSLLHSTGFRTKTTVIHQWQVTAQQEEKMHSYILFHFLTKFNLTRFHWAFIFLQVHAKY